MKRKMAVLVQVIATGGVCATQAAVSAPPQTEASHLNTKAQKSVLPRVGWGEARDGLQIGLFPQNGRKTFRYGDTIALVMRVHNVSGAPLAFTMNQPRISLVTLGESGRLVLQTLGGDSAVPLQLAPDETKELPGSRYEAQIVAPAEMPEPGENTSVALALLPGEYHAECSYPIWMPDKTDASRATAHRAKPGIFTFTVQEDGARQPKIGKTPPAPDTSILWGDTVNGLQGGLRRAFAKDLAALPADKRKEIGPDEILTRFYIRNTMNKPLRLAFHNFDENDASLWVRDAQGSDISVRTTFFTGLRELQEQTLQPGEVTQAGWGRLKFQTQENPREANNYTPLLTAQPGQYTLRIISSARFAGRNNLDMVLVSSAMPFTIPPQ